MILEEDIIRIITEIRKDKKITREELGWGICSGSEIYKLEKGQTAPGYFLLEVLMQRLGMTPDKLEIVLSEEEFAEIRERDDILDDLRRGRPGVAKKRLEHFCAIIESKDAMGQMNSWRMRGILALEKGEYETSETALERAAGFSMGELWEETPQKRLLGDIELETLILLAQVKHKREKYAESEQLLDFVQTYVQNRITDEEQLAKFLPKIACISMETRDREICVPLCEEALELLRKHGMVQLMTPILAYLAADRSGSGRPEEARRFAVWRETLEQVYRHFELSVDMVDKLYFNCCIGQYYLVGEILRAERLTQELSQEKLIEGIYQNPETLSRIENGKKPNIRKLRQLFEKLGIRKRLYGGRVITDDYSLIQLYSEFAILMNHKEEKKAMGLLSVLCSRLDMTIPENRQIIGCSETAYQYKTGKLSLEQACARQKELLELTYRMDSRRVPFEAEALLLNQICRMKWLSKHDSESVELRKRIFHLYEKSRVPLKYHYRTAYLMTDNMAHEMVHLGMHEEAGYWANRGARDELLNGKANSVYFYLSSLTAFELAVNKNRQLGEEMTKWAYYFTDIFKHQKAGEYLEAYEKKHFNENIVWY